MAPDLFEQRTTVTQSRIAGTCLASLPYFTLRCGLVQHTFLSQIPTMPVRISQNEKRGRLTVNTGHAAGVPIQLRDRIDAID